MSSSTIFSIQGKGLKLDTRADVETHLKDLYAMPDVEEVHMGGNTLGVEACQTIAEILKKATKLKVADFADIFTGRLISEIPQSLSAICDALIDKTSLVELNLSDNAFGGRCVDPMVPFLTHNRHFQIFKLNNNGLGPAGGTVVANALHESAKLSKAEGKTSNLRTLICGRNRLENGSAAAWADAFAAHGGLVEVRMPQNGIRMEGIALLAKGLSQCPNLEYLDVQDNTCTASGSRAIAAGLPSWPRLRTLNLSDCLLGGKGGIAIALALQHGSSKELETLKLQYGELDHRSLDLLASAIHDHLPNLTTLELNGNRADPEDECITNIKDALTTHGHEDALDELDDMEEWDGEEVEEGEDEDEAEEDEKDEDEEKEEPVVVKATATDKAADDLADLLGKVSLNN
ncbi:Ran GTPase activator [Sistotremastrum niveocremeum HHB9708]|uniref:Ran GTPase activator n=1 Tax=Sistotremastrum niveocremeum HHB9708 TaxID=1314777 RepID=A0A164XCT2_9AGAM|nr:Ran GTPase activator [Sistotremastrum niveocremeum HHB9708]